MKSEFKCKCHMSDLVIVRSYATIEYNVLSVPGSLMVDYDSPDVTSESDEFELMCKHCGQVYGFRANDSLEYIYEITLGDKVLWKDPNANWGKSDIIQKEIVK